MATQPEPPHEDSRESIWSVTKREQALYFGLFTIFATAGIIYLLANEIFVHGNTSFHHLTRFIITNAGTVDIGAATTSLTTMEAPKITMVVGRYLEERFLRPLQEKNRREAQEQGREQGREEERLERDAQWQEWLDRQQQAQEAGEPLSEPPPNRR